MKFTQADNAKARKYVHWLIGNTGNVLSSLPGVIRLVVPLQRPGINEMGSLVGRITELLGGQPDREYKQIGTSTAFSYEWHPTPKRTIRIYGYAGHSLYITLTDTGAK